MTANIVINGSRYIILFLTWFSGAETELNRWKLPSIDRRSIVVVLWRHANTYCDVILADCHENVSKSVTCVFPPSSSALSLVNYRELFRWRACKKSTSDEPNITFHVHRSLPVVHSIVMSSHYKPCKGQCRCVNIIFYGLIMRYKTMYVLSLRTV